MRLRLLAAVVCAVLGGALPARAEPAAGTRTEASTETTIEASGFVGVDWFGKRSALGKSWAPDQVPGTSPVIGGRIGWLVPPALPGDLRLALEAELGFAPAFTGSSAGDGRTMYFAPVFEWRGQAVLRFTRWRNLVPHLVVGAGGDSVTSSSPFMADDTRPIAYWGPGLVAPMAGGWQLRLDLRQGVMPARSGGAIMTAELELGIGTTFSAPAPRPHPRPRRIPTATASPATPTAAPINPRTRTASRTPTAAPIPTTTATASTTRTTPAPTRRRPSTAGRTTTVAPTSCPPRSPPRSARRCGSGPATRASPRPPAPRCAAGSPSSTGTPSSGSRSSATPSAPAARPSRGAAPRPPSGT